MASTYLSIYVRSYGIYLFVNIFSLTYFVCLSVPRRLLTQSHKKFKVQKGCTQPPQFSAHVLWPNGWMDQDATWYGCRPQRRRLCVRWGPSFPPPPKKKKGTQPPIFGPCLLWWPNGCVDEDATWYGSRQRRRRHSELMCRHMDITNTNNEQWRNFATKSGGDIGRGQTRPAGPHVEARAQSVARVLGSNTESLQTI